MKRKYYLMALFAFAAISMAITFKAMPHDFWANYEPQNLKILPDTISGEKLHHVMESFSEALDVKCSFCHAFKKGGKHLDFASDDNHHKLIARGMMNMVHDINHNYFLKYQKGEEVELVSCITCHNGEKEPKMMKINRSELR